MRRVWPNSADRATMPSMTTLLMPLPTEGFDPTETAVPWKHLREAGIDVVFATPDGRPGRCDPQTLERIVFGQLGARPEDARLYRDLTRDRAFGSPLRYDEITTTDFDGVHLPGGHAPGMKPYLESEILRTQLVEFFDRDLIVSAICHGPVLLARTIDPSTGKSVLHGRRLTALTRMLERSGFWLTWWKLGRHFRTYPEYVENEVTRAIGPDGRFERGPLLPSYDAGFTVRDGNLITARWPGDAESLGRQLVGILRSKGPPGDGS